MTFYSFSKNISVLRKTYKFTLIEFASLINMVDSIAKSFGISAIAKLPIDPNFAKLSDAGQIETYDIDYVDSIIDVISKI